MLINIFVFFSVFTIGANARRQVTTEVWLKR